MALIPVAEWRALTETDGLCHCGVCGGTMFDRNPAGPFFAESHPSHAHPEQYGDGIADRPRCFHLACFLKDLEAK